MKMILILFDLDGTLLSTGGAGMRAFRRALLDVYNIDMDAAGKRAIRPDGKTDPLILNELLALHPSKEARSEALRSKMFARYLDCLEEEMVRSRESGGIRVLPGIRELLERLHSEPGFAVGLATGNIEQGARIKLESAGLYKYFNFGGFGSDSGNRTLLTRIGIQRGIRHVSPAFVEGVFVIGDTPLDIEHGRAAGAGVIAVAGGAYSLEDLHACGPELALPDLGRTESVISFIKSRAATAGSRQWEKCREIGPETQQPVA